MDLHKLAKRCTQDWLKKQTRNIFAALYLYYRPSSGTVPGDVVVAEDPPSPDFVLADPQRLSPAWTTEQINRHIYTVIRRLPILPPV